MVTAASTPEEVNVTDAIVGNVTNAIGLNSSTGNPNGGTPQWIPSDLPGGGGSTTWGPGNQVLGGITVGIVFHFANGSGTPTNRVKFDVTVAGWPWVSSNDVLGLAVEADAFALPGGSHFSYTSSNDTIAQEWNSNNTTISSLAFGPTANVTGSSPSVVRVTTQVELSPTGPDPTMAGALLTFAGAGGYSQLIYDPWLFFGPHAVGSLLPPPVVSASSAASLPLVAVGAIAAAAVVLGGIAYRVRRHPVDRELASAG